MYKSYGTKFMDKIEGAILVKIAKFNQNTRAQVIRYRRVARLRVFWRLAMPARMWTTARFLILKFFHGCMES